MSSDISEVTHQETGLLTGLSQGQKQDALAEAGDRYGLRRYPGVVLVSVLCIGIVIGYAAQDVGRTDSSWSSSTADLKLTIDDDDPYLTVVDSCGHNCGGSALEFPEEIHSKDGVLDYTIKVRAARYNGPISFNTRSYSRTGMPGPTIHVKPGDAVKIKLQNDLEFPTQADITWEGYEYDVATSLGACEPYTQPNMTSLHFHGMLISMNKKGDSPYRVCGPQEVIEYEFTIPTDHPSGTFFYHPHGDGSHSIQITGLMAGAFIVDDTKPDVTDNDDTAGCQSKDGMVTTRTGNCVSTKTMDYIKSTTEALQSLSDVTMLLQWQSIMATFKNYDFLTRCSHSNMPVDQTIYTGAQGYDFMLINGWYKPVHEMKRGVFERWRLVNGMSHRYIGYEVSDKCEAYAIASDGVYYDEPRLQKYIGLSLGARMDILIACDESNEARSMQPPWLKEGKYTHLFGDDPGFYEHMFMNISVTEPTDADKEMKEASDEIRKSISSGTFKLDSGYLGMDLTEGTDEEWYATAGGEYVPTDNIDTAAFYNPKLSDGHNTVTEWYTLNFKEYNGRIQRRVRLNQLQIWNVTHKPKLIMGHHKNHNWHLHSYHFQIMKMIDMRGNEYFESPMKDWKAGDWRDTVSVPCNGTVYIRFKPTKFKGLVLHHCHIYNHETAGMKELVAVEDCSKSTLDDMKSKMCSRRRLEAPSDAPDGYDFTWPWFEQDTESQCEDTIDYLCSKSGMEMNYNEWIDSVLT